MRKLSLLVIALVTIASSQAFAINGDQMIGFTAMEGARAGAVVASPVDTPGILHNPATPAELGINKLAFDLSLGLVHAPRSITNSGGATTDSDSELYLGMGNGIVGRVGEKLYFGLAGAGVSGLGVDFPSTTLPANSSIVTTKSLFKITPELAFKINDKFSVGASVQFGYQTLALKNPQFVMPQTGEFGIGAAIGAIYHITPNTQAGISYTIKTNISEYKFNGRVGTTEGSYNLEMDAPSNFAVGIAVRPMPRLLIEADARWYGFSDVYDKIDIKNSSGAAVSTLNFGWSDRWAYAIGVEFEAMPSVTLRGGYNYIKSPIGAEDVNSNLGSIAVMEHHLSVGVTKKWSPALSSTISYMRAFQNEVQSDVSPYNTIRAEQNIVYIQLSYRM